jgi:hypothetical protein
LIVGPSAKALTTKVTKGTRRKTPETKALVVLRVLGG